MVVPLLTLEEEKQTKREEDLELLLPAVEEKDIVEIAVVESDVALIGGEGELGARGTESKAEARYGVKGPADNPDPHIARQAALRDAAEFGMIGLLNSGAGGDPDAPTAPWGRDDSLGNDPLSARGNMWGDAIGDSFGAGGLGLTGIGEGGGGRGEGIGLGSIGTLGHGAGTGSGYGIGSGKGRLHGSHSKPPSVRMGAVSVSGRLPPEVIQRIVRQNFGRFRLCYENGLRKDPTLSGKVVVDFTIAADGSVSAASATTTMSDASVGSCVSKAFFGLSFPQPEGGASVKVIYPVVFEPGDAANASLGSGSAGDASASAGPTVGGAVLAQATSADVSRALKDAGCTDVSSRASGAATILTASLGSTSYTITFVPASAGADALPAEEIARLGKEASVRRSGAFLLAVESTDKEAARTLLASLVKAH
ncbi:MAG: AgmX/PglI C-terminal domain-containing protein [Polyangiaceae bacterium]|nr:AgmX/PglI C-terminal domain-containing protein [Polyangiaceae bacterium]